MTWNEFKKLVDSSLSEEQKNYDIDYIDISATFIGHTEVFVDEKCREIAIH